MHEISHLYKYPCGLTRVPCLTGSSYALLSTGFYLFHLYKQNMTSSALKPRAHIYVDLESELRLDIT